MRTAEVARQAGAVAHVRFEELRGSKGAALCRLFNRIFDEAVRNPTVTGYVKDLRPFIAASAMLIVPLHAAGGMRVKILEAWARGLPVVSTTIGAEGLKVRPGENILIADAPEAFARAVIRLLRDPVYRQQLAVNGRQWVEQHYNWRTVYRKFDEVVYEGLSDRATSR